MSEVLVVDRVRLFGGDWPQGFTPIAPAAVDAFLQDALTDSRYEDRVTAERTPAWKQWIPYCVLRCAPGPFEAAATPDRGVFAVQRTKGQGETRLHGAWSIGLGGHVEPEDGRPTTAAGVAQAFFTAALRRELTEELLWVPTCLPDLQPRLLGLVNDDSTEVGRVHAGLAYVLDLPLAVPSAQRSVGIREVSKMHGGFTHLVELRKLWQNPAQLETWSRLLVDAGILGHTETCGHL